MPTPPASIAAALARRRLFVTGVVQGVGFRPFVYTCAIRNQLTGFVGNDSQGVFIEIEGSIADLDLFQSELTLKKPPLAHIEDISAIDIPAMGSSGFQIVESHSTTAVKTLVSPDICLCDDCLAELEDPTNRRYRYPFINCTNCGPRFTIIKSLPYDRPATTMAGFVMCPACQSEYDDPTDRRFHAQPNACPECGPHVEYFDIQDPDLIASSDAAMYRTQQALAEGRIMAIKGIGGFHLACDARNNQALETLRSRKGRIDKPFAVMARSLDVIRQFAEVSDDEQALLTSRERPIVLLRHKSGSNLSPLIAPGNEYIGVMLPYAPLHFVLMTSVKGGPSVPEVLVMTSGNFSNEPIVTTNSQAVIRLADMADAFLVHNREINVPCDDSVVRVFQKAELPIRRSRGYAPFPVKLPFSTDPILAVGGELKSTFCLTKDNYAILSQHIGDMENLETLQVFEQSVTHLTTLFQVEPQAVAYDLHPGYLSTKWAGRYVEHSAESPKTLVGVQHHHAHIAAALAEHQWNGTSPVIGFSFDGTGYGLDGAIWGGEVLLADYKGFQRAAHLRYVPLPGGDVAVRKPYRCALAHLWAAGVEWNEALPPVQECSLVERNAVLRQLQTGLNAVATSSMGRLFDAVASLAGVRHRVTYEAQAAIEFEALTNVKIEGEYRFDLIESEPIQIDPTPAIREIARDVRTGFPVELIGGKFHKGVASLILNLARHFRKTTHLTQVALSGGVFQNTTLLELVTSLLHNDGFEVFTHSQVPPNDGGLALGQAVIAHMVGAEKTRARG
ncbi:MAG TPA: carbamoyltransferase HypF [Acidobacteriota bacterium]|nr:carbamoyltransferase HypF [Acidobacteriota bacterium]